MSTAIMEAQLTDALNGDAELGARGCRATSRRGSGIEIDRRGAVVGVWHWRNGGFELVAGASEDPVVKVETVAEAVHYTREHVCRSS